MGGFKVPVPPKVESQHWIVLPTTEGRLYYVLSGVAVHETKGQGPDWSWAGVDFSVPSRACPPAKAYASRDGR